MSKHDEWQHKPALDPYRRVPRGDEGQTYERFEHFRRDDIARIAELEAENKRLVPFRHAVLFAIGVGILSALAGAFSMFTFRG